MMTFYNEGRKSLAATKAHHIFTLPRGRIPENEAGDWLSLD